MNQLDMLTTLVDAARTLPENGHLKTALRAAEKRIGVIESRYARRRARVNALAATGTVSDSELAAIAQANPERFRAAGRCDSCGYVLAGCRCSEPAGQLPITNNQFAITNSPPNCLWCREPLDLCQCDPGSAHQPGINLI